MSSPENDSGPQRPKSEGARMATKTTRPAGARGSVSCGAIDELLDETPDFPEHRRGRLGGMDKGKGVRWGLAALALVVPLGIWGVMRVVQADVQAHRFDVPFPAQVPQGEDAVMHWNAGHARLGLHRDGVRKIVLPDAEISLAEGQVHAQVWVVVEKGRVLRVKELVGKVEIVRNNELVNNQAQGLGPGSSSPTAHEAHPLK